MEAPGGYVAAVVINRLRGIANAPREAFRDTVMSGGHRWAKPEEALRFAVNKAQQLVQADKAALAC